MNNHRSKVDVVDGRDEETRENSFGADSNWNVCYNLAMFSNVGVYYLDDKT